MRRRVKNTSAKAREGKEMILSAKLKAQVKTLLIKLIRGKKTSIIGMKEKAYEYVREHLPKWLVFIFDGYIRNKIDTLFMEALSSVKCD